MKLIGTDRAGLASYVQAQLASFFPDGADHRTALERYLDEALARTGRCVDAVRMWRPGEFDYLHSSQYATFLYYLSNSIWRDGGDPRACTKLFCLNKALNAMDLFYEVIMPEVFLIGHSVGIVLAKATYGNYLVLYQNSTVGKNHGAAPVIGDGVVMYPNTAIIGRSHVGNGSVIAQGVSVINRDTPGDCLVYAGHAGDLVCKPVREPAAEEYFRL
ncbi:LbetaH domain-containing protein [Cupriavidus sp. PET2-C1]